MKFKIPQIGGTSALQLLLSVIVVSSLNFDFVRMIRSLTSFFTLVLGCSFVMITISAANGHSHSGDSSSYTLLPRQLSVGTTLKQNSPSLLFSRKNPHISRAMIPNERVKIIPLLQNHPHRKDSRLTSNKRGGHPSKTPWINQFDCV